jgi:predicted ATPase
MEPENGTVRDTEQGQEIYWRGLGWSVADNMVQMDMYCAGQYGCGKTWTTAEAYPEKDVSVHYLRVGQPIAAVCSDCDLSDRDN